MIFFRNSNSNSTNRKRSSGLSDRDRIKWKLSIWVWSWVGMFLNHLTEGLRGSRSGSGEPSGGLWGFLELFSELIVSFDCGRQHVQQQNIDFEISIETTSSESRSRDQMSPQTPKNITSRKNSKSRGFQIPGLSFYAVWGRSSHTIQNWTEAY